MRRLLTTGPVALLACVFLVGCSTTGPHLPDYVVLSRHVTHGVHWQLDAYLGDDGLCLTVDGPRGPEAAWRPVVRGLRLRQQPLGRLLVRRTGARRQERRRRVRTAPGQCHRDQSGKPHRGQDNPVPARQRPANRPLLVCHRTTGMAEQDRRNAAEHAPTIGQARQECRLQEVLTRPLTPQAICNTKRPGEPIRSPGRGWAGLMSGTPGSCPRVRRLRPAAVWRPDAQPQSERREYGCDQQPEDVVGPERRGGQGCVHFRVSRAPLPVRVPCRR